MKKYISILLAFLLLGALSSCKKDPGTGGKKTVKGTVTYSNASGTTAAAGGAVVSIKYDAKDGSANAFDATVTADGSGVYSIPELTRGDYFIDAAYTDQFGIVYYTAGAHILIDKKKGDLTVDFVLK